jgi:hypothetical protein
MKMNNTNNAVNGINEALTIGTPVVGNYMGEYAFRGVIKSYHFACTRISYVIALDEPAVMFGMMRSEVSISAGYSDSKCELEAA